MPAEHTGVQLVLVTLLQKLLRGQAAHTRFEVLLQGLVSYWVWRQGAVQLLQTVSVISPQAVLA